MNPIQLLIALFLIPLYQLDAQTETKKESISNIGISLNTRFIFADYIKFEDVSISQTKTEFYNLDQEIMFGFSFEKIKGKFYYEFEVPGIYFQNKENLELIDFTGQNILEPSGQQEKILHLSLRYGVGMFIINRDILKFGISLGAQNYFEWIDIVPLTSINFPTTYTSIGLAMQIVPKINLRLKKDIFLELKVAPNILDFHYTRRVVDNPTLSSAMRTTNNFDLRKVSSTINLSFGIKYSLVGRL